MGKDKKTPLTVNDKEYFVEDMSDQEKIYVNHISDLDRKIGSSQFNMDQLHLGRMKAVELLAASLESDEEEATEASH